jgi:hypothetical protein
VTPEQRQEMHRLCNAIQTETDQNKFSELVRQLNDLLENGLLDLEKKRHSLRSEAGDGKHRPSAGDNTLTD